MLAGLLALAAFTGGVAGADATEPPAPVIEGEARQGETLTAVTPIPADLIRWQRCDPAQATCDGAGGHGDPSWSDIPGADADAYTLTAADVGLFVRVLAKYTSLGSKWAASEPVGPIAPALGPAPPPPAEVAGPPPEEPLPPPIARKTANIDPLSGTTFVREPGESGFRHVTEPEQIRLGSVLDVASGHADVTTERNVGSGKLQTAEFWAGTFRITQGKGRKPVTRLRLVGRVGGPFGNRAGAEPRTATAAARRKGRRLWGRGRCRCRTRGRHSSGTVRGTWWLTVERPRSTVTKVKQGAVQVHDFGLRTRTLVRAGERYVARARGR